MKFNQNGNWILTACRDQVVRLFDIRTMKQVESFIGHKKEVQCKYYFTQLSHGIRFTRLCLRVVDGKARLISGGQRKCVC